jgi:hypothetical protein
MPLTASLGTLSGLLTLTSKQLSVKLSTMCCSSGRAMHVARVAGPRLRMVTPDSAAQPHRKRAQKSGCAYRTTHDAL